MSKGLPNTSNGTKHLYIGLARLPQSAASFAFDSSQSPVRKNIAPCSPGALHGDGRMTKRPPPANFGVSFSGMLLSRERIIYAD